MNIDKVKILSKYFREKDNIYTGPVRTDWGPTVCTVDQEGYFHQELNRPAIVSLNEQHFIFWHNRQYHRTDGPATIESFGTSRRLRWFLKDVFIKEAYVKCEKIPADLFKDY